jgi:hypothetical protein
LWIAEPKCCYEPWVNVPSVGLGTLLNVVGLRTLLIFTCLQPITMAPYSRWVLPSFKDTLLSACDEYMRSNDRGNGKTQSMLITRISQEIAAIAQEKNERVPEELEKVIFLTILHFINNNGFCRVSAHGSVTMHLDIRKRSQKSRRRIVVAILHLPKHGMRSLCVHISSRSASLTSKRGFPMVEKKTLESIVLHCRIFLRNSVRRS